MWGRLLSLSLSLSSSSLADSLASPHARNHAACVCLCVCVCVFALVAQLFFYGHDDDITALALSPADRLTVVSGQLGKDPKILVWKSRPDAPESRVCPQLMVIHGDHKRAIIGLSFSRNGEFIASMGADNNRSVALYAWKKGPTLEKMRLAIDKGARARARARVCA